MPTTWPFISNVVLSIFLCITFSDSRKSSSSSSSSLTGNNQKLAIYNNKYTGCCSCIDCCPCPGVGGE